MACLAVALACDRAAADVRVSRGADSGPGRTRSAAGPPPRAAGLDFCRDHSLRGRAHPSLAGVEKQHRRPEAAHHWGGGDVGPGCGGGLLAAGSARTYGCAAGGDSDRDGADGRDPAASPRATEAAGESDTEVGRDFNRSGGRRSRGARFRGYSCRPGRCGLGDGLGPGGGDGQWHGCGPARGGAVGAIAALLLDSGLSGKPGDAEPGHRGFCPR